MMGAGGMPNAQQMQEQQAKATAQEEQRKGLLQKILTPEAADRLARIELVKPDKVGIKNCWNLGRMRATASVCCSHLHWIRRG